MKVLSPMSQDDDAERRSGDNDVHIEAEDEDEEYNDGEKRGDKGTTRWQRTVEHALVKMTAEIAALREQISTGREYQGKKQRSFRSWVGWILWMVVRHCLVDLALLGLVLLYMRKRRDRRIEDLVREAVEIGREYVRKILPAR